jgi:hypothetical protein
MTDEEREAVREMLRAHATRTAEWLESLAADLRDGVLDSYSAREQPHCEPRQHYGARAQRYEKRVEWKIAGALHRIKITVEED